MPYEIRKASLPRGACPDIRREYAVTRDPRTGEILDENAIAYCCVRKRRSLGNPTDPGYDRINQCMAGGSCPLAEKPDL